MMSMVEPETGGPVRMEGSALADVYRTHYGRLVGLARLLVDQREQAEEIVQEAFTRTYAAGGRVKGDPLGYVRMAVVNNARSALRRRRTVRETHLRPVPDAPSAEVNVLHSERRNTVADAVRALPQRQRECVVLRYFNECSTAETAAPLGISEGAVKSNLHRALETLGVALKDEQ